MKILLVVKVILWFADENLSASVWFHGVDEIIPHWKDVYSVTVEKALDGIIAPPLMEWCGDWKHLQQPNTYFRLMRKKSNLTAAADSQMQVTITTMEVQP